MDTLHKGIAETLIHNYRHHDPAGDEGAEAWTHEINNATRFYEKKYGGQDLGVNGNACMFVEKSEDIWGTSYPRLRKIKVVLPSHVFYLLNELSMICSLHMC